MAPIDSFFTLRTFSLQAEQENDVNRAVTTILHVNIYELNAYAPRFVAAPYTMIGYVTNSLEQIPTLVGNVTDMDTVRFISGNSPPVVTGTFNGLFRILD